MTDIDRRGQAYALLGAVQATVIATMTVVVLPLPAIGRELGLDPAGAALVGVAFALAFGVLLPVGGRLVDRYGARPPMVVGLAAFAGASITAALASGFATLAIARLAQGASAALIAPAALAAVRLLTARTAQPKLAAAWGGLSVLGAAAGALLPGLAGAAGDWVSWRWGFAPAVLVSAAALHLAPRLVSDPPRRALRAPPRRRPAGRGRAPAPVAYLADRRRVLGLLAIGLSATGAALAGLLLVAALPAERVAPAFLPGVAALVLAGRLARRPLARYGSPALLTAGLASGAAGLLLLSRVGPDTGYLTVVLPGLLLLGAGLALVFAAGTVLTLAGVPAHRSGLAGGALNGALALGVVTALAFAGGASGTAAATTGVGAAFALLAMLTPLAVPPRVRIARFDVALNHNPREVWRVLTRP
ncbi:MFS transporter [Micromonospora sp. CPCC 206061]|uniref:MFS transporter n=1 Tax=Micromonospora sp. CPCC 206061 TaxID=3122410 RepID=UPI002FF1E813